MPTNSTPTNSTRTSSTPWRIPYGVADFIKLRRGREFYVDKTQYLPLLEDAGRFLFLIRPRRFGKSLLQSMMECYYDSEWGRDFDTLFADTWIAERPTPERGRYLALRFDFSAVRAESALVEDSFEAYTRIILIDFLKRHARTIPADTAEAVLAEGTTARRIERLIGELRALGASLYLFIDEYDNFANNLLVSEGAEAYRRLTHDSGFFRHFFTLLKEAVGRTGGGLARLFVTGVSPLTMDDVTSGFNIGANISLDPRFNGLLGFDHDELETLFAAFGQDLAPHRAVIDAWYDHYHFHEDRLKPIVNSDMALYYLQSLVGIGKPPRELIDHNVRIDYSKLRHLVRIDRRLGPAGLISAAPGTDPGPGGTRDAEAQAGAPSAPIRLNGNFSRLRAIIETGEQVGTIQTSFPVEGLARQENFISLLYYLGLLTFAGEKEGSPLLRIPNLTVRQLMYGYLREAYQDAEVFRPSTWEIAERLRGMAYRGDWAPFFDYLAEQIAQQASVRDYLQGEKMIQGFLLAWLNLSPYFQVWSEAEQGGGFVDLYLAPFYFRYPDMRHAYLIELKYLKRGEDSPARRTALIAAARDQLQGYASDRRVRDTVGEARLHSLVLLYSGWELVHRESLAEEKTPSGSA